MRRLVFALLGILAAPAWAGDAPEAMVIPRVLAYDGVLELDGLPRDGAVDARFTLYDGADGRTLWQEEWSQAAGRALSVRGGFFHAALGRYVSLNDTLASGATLLLGLEVKAAGADAWIALAGRQQIDGVAAGLWSFDADRLDVGGSLTIGGDVTITGALDLDPGRVTVGRLSAAEIVSFYMTAQSLTVAGEADILVPRAVDEGWPTITADTMVIEGFDAPWRRVDLVAGDLVARGVDWMASAPQLATAGLTGNHARLIFRDNDTLVFDPDAWAQALRLEGSTIQLGTEAAPMAVSIPGPLTATLTRASVAGDMTLNGDLQASSLSNPNGPFNAGQVHIRNCRFCLQFRRGNVTRHSCVSLDGSNAGGRFNVDSNFDAQAQFSVVHVCDELGNSSGPGLVPVGQ